MTTGEPSPGGGIRLPRPERLRLEHFSLYSRQPDIEVEFGDGVFCLAGANGLGKSTFLTALNFAITGLVPEPGRNFTTVQAWYKNTSPYSSTFWRGRIADGDRELARISISMRVGDRRYELSRSPFEPTALASLRIVSLLDGDDIEIVADDPELEGTERHDLYAGSITEDCGLDSFVQLAFLQHFVVTFDEERRLIFWDDPVARAAMYIVFGIDAKQARRADQLVSEISKADSRARNLQWQSSDLRKQLRNLEKTGEQVAEDEIDGGIDERHRELVAEHEEAGKRVERLSAEVADAQLAISDRTGKLRSARDEYDALWRARLHGHGHPRSHPLVEISQKDRTCALCGTEGEQVVEAISSELDADRCPLCKSALTETADGQPEDLAERLESVDQMIVALQEELGDGERALAEISKELDEAREAFASAADELQQYESDNELAAIRALQASGGVDAVARRWRAQIADLQKRKREEIANRNRDRAELEQINKDLVAAYARAEQLFVPDFVGLAREFLGLDLSIEMVVRSAAPGLMVTVQGTRRRAGDALSESQRFFIDIALRMALTGQLSADWKPGLLIDTPEGSLDIAYEARAGTMFAMFTERGFQLIMTANINTSQLLKRLAETCGPAAMRLVRMTDWTDLSDVQVEEEHLFDEAYAVIENALETGG